MLHKAFDTFEETLKKPEITMTPLVDMVFILLIFFVVTTTFTKETGIRVDKAKATTSQIINKKLLLVAIDESGSYWHNKMRMSLDEVIPVIVKKTEQSDDLKIVIIPDKNGRIEPLISLMDRLRTHNLTRFSLGTQLIDRL